MKKEAVQIDQALSQRERLLEERIKHLESTLSSFQSVLDPTVRGKGRGKKSSIPTKQTAQSQPSTSTGTRQRSQKPPSVASEIWTDDLDDDDVETFFIKNVELTLNGSPIDQIEDLQTEDECMSSYFRLYYNNGQMNSLYSCGISYDDFRYDIKGPYVFQGPYVSKDHTCQRTI